MQDPTGASIIPGTLLLNEQGKIFEAMETDASIAKEQLVKVKTRQGHTYLRLWHIFVITSHLRYLNQQGLSDVWKRRYEKHVRPKVRQEILERKARIGAIATSVRETRDAPCSYVTEGCQGTMTVDGEWATGVTLPSGYTAQPGELLRFYHMICKTCGFEQWS